MFSDGIIKYRIELVEKPKISLMNYMTELS